MHENHFSEWLQRGHQNVHLEDIKALFTDIGKVMLRETVRNDDF